MTRARNVADIIKQPFTTTLGTSNYRAGVNAGNSIASGGNYNVVLGDEAGTAITTGVNNVFIGYQSGDALTEGGSNVSIGMKALTTEVLGVAATAVGYSALENQNMGAATANYNVGVGYKAGEAVTSGVQNTIIGGLAGDALTDADGNVVLGSFALSTDTLGARSVSIGHSALLLQNFTTATNNYNTAVGYEAGRSVTTGFQNTLIGGLAGDALTGNGFDGNDDRVAGADYNVAIGYNSLTTDTKGSRTVAIGRAALEVQNFTSATTTYNTAVGYKAGGTVSTGVNNTLVGGEAGANATTADSSVFVGYAAGQGISGTKLTGNNNTAVGRNTGLVLQGAATGNQLFGTFAGDQITTGTYNVCIGYDVGSSVQNLTTGNKNILIGYKTSGPSTQDNAIGIGDTVTVVANDFSFGKASNIVTNDFDADAAFSRSSDERLKKNITNQTLGLDFINDLRTVKYNWKPSDELDANDAELAHLRVADDDGNIINHMNTDVLMHNFIAQEVKTALNTAGVSEFGGWKEDQFGVQQVSREMFVIPLVKAVQELSTALDAALARITTLEG